MMDRPGRERILARIAWDKDRARIDLGDSPQSFVLRPPTEEERARSAIVYDEQYESALAQGMMTNAEAIAHAVSIGKWSEQGDAAIDGLRADIEKVVFGMLGYLLQSDKLEVIRKALRRAENALTTKLLEREALLGETAETYARMRQQWALSLAGGGAEPRPAGPRLRSRALQWCHDRALVADRREHWPVLGALRALGLAYLARPASAWQPPRQCDSPGLEPP